MKFFRIARKISVVFAVAALAFCTVPAFAAKEKAAANAETLPATCIPTSREDVKWWKERNDKFNAIAQERSAKILFLGDSITHLWEGGNAQKWMDGTKAWEKYFEPLDALAFGISGDKTENVIWRIDNGNLSGKMNPKLIVLMIGTNNWQNKPEDTALGIKTILDRIKKVQPKAKVLLLAIFPRGADKNDPKRLKNNEVNKIIKKFADNKRVFWADIGNKFLEKDGTLPKTVMPDLLHPNGDGYEIWAKAILKDVKRLAK